MKRDKDGHFVKAKRKYTRRVRRAKLPRVLVLVQGHVKVPYAAIEVQMAKGLRATYVLAGQYKAVE